jgi:hypothetical protein
MNYTSRLLQAAMRGKDSSDALYVTFTVKGREYTGTVNGIGGRLGVWVDATLFEDIHPDNVTHADVRARGEADMSGGTHDVGSWLTTTGLEGIAREAARVGVIDGYDSANNLDAYGAPPLDAIPLDAIPDRFIGQPDAYRRGYDHGVSLYGDDLTLTNY